MALLFALIDSERGPSSDRPMIEHIVVEDEIDVSDPAQTAVRLAVDIVVNVLVEEYERDKDEALYRDVEAPEQPTDDLLRHKAHDLLGHRFRLFRLGKEVS